MKKRYPHKFVFLSFLFLLCCTFIFGQKNTSKRTASPTSKEITIDTLVVDWSVAKKAPVVPFKTDTLFYLYGNVGVVTAEQRAQKVAENIQVLAEDQLFNPDSLKISIEEGIFLILYKDRTIIGITDQQEKALSKSKDEIAKEYVVIIAQAIIKEQTLAGWKFILKQIGLAILILGMTFVAFKSINYLYRRLRIIIQRRRENTIKKLQNIIDSDHQISFIIVCLKVLRFLLWIIITYICLLTFFRVFPETQGISDSLLEYIIVPLNKTGNAIRNFIPDLIYIILIIIIFRTIVKGIRYIVEKIESGAITIKGFYSDWAIPTFNIIKVIVYIFMFILIFPHLPGSNSPAFQGVSVFLGILFSLGSTSIIGNVVSGIVITYMRPFKIGDRIKMGEFLGNVIEKTPLVTRIKTPKNEIITIPNGNIMTAQTINYSNSAKEYGLILYTTLTISYDIPWRKVHELLIEVGLNTPYVLKNPKPFILQTALDDFYVEYQINVYTKEANQMANIYSDLNKNIQDVFNREGIELLSPHYRSLRDGSDVMMPKEYIRENKFKTSPFSMNIKIEKPEGSEEV